MKGLGQIGDPKVVPENKKIIKMLQFGWQVKVQFRKFCVEKKVIIFSFPSLLGA